MQENLEEIESGMGKDEYESYVFQVSQVAKSLVFSRLRREIFQI